MNDIIYCPDCEPTYRKNYKTGKVTICRTKMILIEKNYSGCGVDIFDCPKCKHCFQVSYKVDKIERLKDWECNE